MNRYLRSNIAGTTLYSYIDTSRRGEERKKGGRGLYGVIQASSSTTPVKSDLFSLWDQPMNREQKDRDMEHSRLNRGAYRKKSWRASTRNTFLRIKLYTVSLVVPMRHTDKTATFPVLRPWSLTERTRLSTCRHGWNSFEYWRWLEEVWPRGGLLGGERSDAGGPP